ncbi:MAG: deoxynucleoside kinase [Deinococcus sp.]|nr:deoxynucleoside kinase [Deinococcus sp.]
MYLAIAGNIGSGKSTLTQLLAQRLNLQPVLEPFEENPYLEDFYRDMKRYSFHSQVFFLSCRIYQHLRYINSQRAIVQDRTIYEDAQVFAENLYRSSCLSPRDYRTYQGLFEAVLPALQPPDLLIYLRASTPTLEARIAQRGRSFERQIPTAYLEALNQLYEEWVAQYRLSPLLVVEADQVDFVERPQELGGIVEGISSAVGAPDRLFGG